MPRGGPRCPAPTGHSLSGRPPRRFGLRVGHEGLVGRRRAPGRDPARRPRGLAPPWRRLARIERVPEATPGGEHRREVRTMGRMSSAYTVFRRNGKMKSGTAYGKVPSRRIRRLGGSCQRERRAIREMLATLWRARGPRSTVPPVRARARARSLRGLAASIVVAVSGVASAAEPAAADPALRWCAPDECPDTAQLLAEIDRLLIGRRHLRARRRG